MLDTFGDSIVVYRCLDQDGQILSIRGCVVLGEFAWDWLSATTEVGRKIYASYGLCWELLMHCREIGVKDYDLMGVDIDNNRGVYNFKKGTGAALQTYLGEWEWATNPVIKWVVNLAIRGGGG